MKCKLNKRRPMKRLYYRYEKWECFQSGMYRERKTGEREPYIALAMKLLGDPTRLEKAMSGVTKKWYFSCRNHLTSRNSNRQALLGQMACCYEHGISESETRDAWRLLTPEQREVANSVADRVIDIWEGWHFEYEDSIRG